MAIEQKRRVRSVAEMAELIWLGVRNLSWPLRGSMCCCSLLDAETDEFWSVDKQKDDCSLPLTTKAGTLDASVLVLDSGIRDSALLSLLKALLFAASTAESCLSNVEPRGSPSILSLPTEESAYYQIGTMSKCSRMKWQSFPIPLAEI